MSARSNVLSKPVPGRQLLVLLVGIVLGLAVMFWSTGQVANSRVGVLFLEDDQQGSVSVQADHLVLGYDANWEQSYQINLAALGAESMMGNLAWFSNGDLLFRAGQEESGLKAYFSTAELLKPLDIEVDSRRLDFDYRMTEQDRQDWVNDLSAPSNLVRCSRDSFLCVPFLDQEVPWRHRLMIEEEQQRLYLTDGIRHQVLTYDFDGSALGSLPVDSKFPKRVRVMDERLFLVDTNHASIHLQDGSQDWQVLKPDIAKEAEHRWPLDAYYFDHHWWVLLARGQMQETQLHLFDQNMQAVRQVELPPGSEPYDLLMHDGDLLISDIGQGQLLSFTSAGAAPRIITLPALERYYPSLDRYKALMQGVQYAGGIGLALLILLRIRKIARLP